MSEETAPPSDSPPVTTQPESNPWRTFGIVIITALVTLFVAYFLFTRVLFPDAFRPTQLNDREQAALEAKLDRLDQSSLRSNGSLRPEPYSEDAASREIHFTEKELNALLAKNSDMAEKIAIDLADDLASVKMLIDLPPDFPVMGGKTLRVSAGMELYVADGKPGAILRGVSLWGVPLPNAWLGNLKNTDLIQEFGLAGGFWQAINEGVERIEVKDGELFIRLHE